MSVVPAMADSTVTTAGTDTVSASEVRTEAKATARFLMNNTDFTDISNTSTFYNASRNLILSVRSGYDCSVQADAYLKNVDALLNADGTLNLENASSFANDIYSNYAYLLLTLAVLDKDAADYNGINVVAAFDNIIANATSDESRLPATPFPLRGTRITRPTPSPAMRRPPHTVRPPPATPTVPAMSAVPARRVRRPRYRAMTSPPPSTSFWCWD